MIKIAQFSYFLSRGSDCKTRHWTTVSLFPGINTHRRVTFPGWELERHYILHSLKRAKEQRENMFMAFRDKDREIFNSK